MAKYDPLQRFLRAQSGDIVRMTFAEIDSVVGGLPRSALMYPAWWDNGSVAVHRQARAWVAAGFLVDGVDLNDAVVTFLRSKAGVSPLR